MIRFVKRLLSYLAIAVLGFIVGAAMIYIYIVRSGPELQPWHTEELTAEFTAERRDEVQTFDDYRQLEDTLFAQLEQQIYARTETGPAYKLARYSSGSDADPHRLAPNWNRSFELPADTPLGGVLLLHGMSDSPYSLRALGETLNQRGQWVIGLRLPGHGTVPSGIANVRQEDMAAAVRLGMAHLASKVGSKSIHIVGYSTGAPLALDFALNALEGSASPVPSSLVLISLSHVALPFPPDDPIYGQRRPDDTDIIYLGQIPLQGERGLLLFSADWLLRLRYNPFYDYVENRVIDWLHDASGQTDAGAISRDVD